MSNILVIKKLNDKLRQDITDEDIDKVIHEGEDLPKDLKQMFIEASNIMPDKEPEEFDKLEEPSRLSFTYQDLVEKGELLGEEKLKSLGLSNKK